jgi:hypothetical protein
VLSQGLVSRWRELYGDLGKRGRIAVVAGAVLLVVGLPALLIGPLARSRVEKRAAAQGLVADVGSVRPSFRGLWLLDVSVKSTEPRRVEGTLDAVLVPFAGGAVEVHGGRFALRGSVSELRRALRLNAEPSGAARGQARSVRAEGLAVRWSELDARGSRADAWGVRLSRGETQRVEVDLLRLESRGVTLTGRRAELAPLAGKTGRFAKLELAALDASLDLDAAKAEASAPNAVAPPAPNSALVNPPAAPASNPALNAAAKLAAATSALKEFVPEGATVNVAAARFDVRFGAEALGIGPSRLSFQRNPQELFFELAPSERPEAGVTPLALRGHLPLGEGLPSLEIEGGPVSLGVLGMKDGELGLRRTRDATIEAHLKLELAPGGVVRAAGSGAVGNLALQRAELGPRELTGLRLAFRGSGELALDGSRLHVGDSEISVGDVKFAGKLDVEREAAGVRIRGDGGVPLASCDAMLGSLPPALIGDLSGVKLSGTFGLTASVAYDSTRPDDLEVKLKVANDCRVVDAPAAYSPERFRSSWTREVKAPDGSSVLTQSGPGTADYMRYNEISRHMETAVLVCEDGGFYRHRGFDFRAIEKALRADLQAGRFLRGASTISMQLAKNLYLGREKTLSRKVQEALLTMLLEERLSKQEIMELYLNIVELGPGIYGVGQAAEHYFAKSASELSLAQSLYLASILPDPTRQHFTPDGAVTPRWAQYLKKLMTIARQVKLITDEELESALAEEVAFRKPGEGATPGSAGLEPVNEFTPSDRAPDFDALRP